EAAVRAAATPERGADPRFALQREQLGTGDAVRQTVEHLSGGTVLIIAGDVPLVTAETLRVLLDAHREGGFAATILSTRLPDPTGYGRILRADDGGFDR